MIQLTRRFEFSAAHRYWRSDWPPEQNQAIFGTCTSPYGHGHNYTLDVTVEGEADPLTGMVMNLTTLKNLVSTVLEAFDHKHLNEDTPYFRDRLPTTENIVQTLWHLIEPGMPEGVRLARLRLYEMPGLWADYTGSLVTDFSRSYTFSAAHRLSASGLSEAENEQIFGKCTNPNGHGHNYTLEVTVRGPADPATGMVHDLAAMDATVNSVLAELDHRYLDREIDAFQTQTSTGENITAYLWTQLAPRFSGQLVHLRLWETPNNIFDYSGALNAR